jgi:ATPase subunit of ABC transporter with duplicated ATPase domains
MLSTVGTVVGESDCYQQKYKQQQQQQQQQRQQQQQQQQQQKERQPLLNEVNTTSSTPLFGISHGHDSSSDIWMLLRSIVSPRQFS